MPNDGTTPLEVKARLFRALGDPSRLAVFEALRDGPKCVSDLVAKTGLSQPNVSGHLAFLRDSGIVAPERRGRFVYYSFGSRDIETILVGVESFLRERQ